MARITLDIEFFPSSKWYYIFFMTLSVLIVVLELKWYLEDIGTTKAFVDMFFAGLNVVAFSIYLRLYLYRKSRKNKGMVK